LTLKYEAKKQRQKALRGLLNFLREISFGLKELDVTSFYILKNSSLPSALKILKSTGLMFPNLKKLNSLESNYQGQAQIHGLFIERTPNLQIMDIRHLHHKGYLPELTSHTPIKLERLKAFKFDQIDLKKFIKNFSLPKIQKVNMCICNGGADIDLYREILSRVSPTLKSLTVSLNLDLVPEAKLIAIPILGLPHLEKFCLKLIYDENTPIFVNPDDYNFLPETLPALKSVDIPIGYMFEEGWPLLTVQHLTIRVNDTKFLPIFYKHTSTARNEVAYSELIHVKKHSRDNRRISIKQNIGNLMMRFPNVTSVSIVNECYENPKNMNEAINELLQRGDSFPAQKIDTFEIRNYDQDYLSQVLGDVENPPRIILENFNIGPKLESVIKNLFAHFTGGQNQDEDAESQRFDRVEFTKYDGNPTNFSKMSRTPPLGHGLEYVKRIRLEGCSKKYYNNSLDRLGYTKSFSEMTATPSLKSIAKHFPHITHLELSRSMFDTEKRRIDAERKYPNWTINLI